MKLWHKVAGMCVAAVLMAASNLCINASKVDGKMPYLSITVTFLVEALKFAACIVVLLVSPPKLGPHQRYWLGWKESLYFAAPALLYTVDNNLAFVILRFIDPATLSVLWNLKILTTAALFRFVLRRKLGQLQIIALMLLVLGVVTSQTKHTVHHGVHDRANATALELEEGTRFMLGIALVAIGCAISSLAGILAEYALKKNPSTPFFLQNGYMYIFGLLFNTAGLLAEHSNIAANGFFAGYNGWTWTVVLIQAFAGLMMGFIFKYLDNIVCVYTHVVAMMLTMLVSILFFAFELTLEFSCGFGVCAISMYLYHLPDGTSQQNSCHGTASPSSDEEYEKLAMDSDSSCRSTASTVGSPHRRESSRSDDEDELDARC
ncbi:UDP-sugar transporter [Achlya hypogyna]|uniref:UDP-sugar transporter n=1 Tax=Achlya hypogyna TaxID=1202772 RepID=A0A1V9YH52_ACHHY|nr:UDP-sugar transporter [Achlya hypogyna]